MTQRELVAAVGGVVADEYSRGMYSPAWDGGRRVAVALRQRGYYEEDVQRYVATVLEAGKEVQS
jgi:hypothetical protein